MKLPGFGRGTESALLTIPQWTLVRYICGSNEWPPYWPRWFSKRGCYSGGMDKVDPAEGMRRLQDTMRKLLRVPKTELDAKLAESRKVNAEHEAKRAARRKPA